MCQLKDGLAKGAPAQIWLLTQEKGEVGGIVVVEGVAGHVEIHDTAFLDLQVRAKQGTQLHRAGEVEKIEWFGIDLGKRRSTEQVDQPANGPGGYVAAVHPAAEGEQERGPIEGRLAVKAQDRFWFLFAHGDIV